MWLCLDLAPRLDFVPANDKTKSVALTVACRPRPRPPKKRFGEGSGVQFETHFKRAFTETTKTTSSLKSVSLFNENKSFIPRARPCISVIKFPRLPRPEASYVELIWNNRKYAGRSVYKIAETSGLGKKRFLRPVCLGNVSNTSLMLRTMIVTTMTVTTMTATTRNYRLCMERIEPTHTTRNFNGAGTNGTFLRIVFASHFTEHFNFAESVWKLVRLFLETEPIVVSCSCEKCHVPIVVSSSCRNNHVPIVVSPS